MKIGKIKKVEREFGESFDEVIRGFAIMGYSRRALASILGFNLSYLRLLIKKRDLGRHFRPQKDMRDECKPKPSGGGWPKGKKRPFNPKYSDGHLLDQVRMYPNYSDFRTFASVDYSTVIRRFGIRWKKIVAMALQREKEGPSFVPGLVQGPAGLFSSGTHDSQEERSQPR